MWMNKPFLRTGKENNAHFTQTQHRKMHIFHILGNTSPWNLCQLLGISGLFHHFFIFPEEHHQWEPKKSPKSFHPLEINALLIKSQSMQGLTHFFKSPINTCLNKSILLFPSYLILCFSLCPCHFQYWQGQTQSPTFSMLILGLCHWQNPP